MQTFSSTDGFKPADLAQSARDHFNAVMILFEKRDAFVFDSAGYLAHIAIELVLKALLLDLRGSFPAEHDLAKLTRLVAQDLPGFGFTPEGERILASANAFGELRYPSPARRVEIGTEDLEEIIHLFQRLWDGLPESLYPTRDSNDVRKGGRVLMRKRVGDSATAQNPPASDR